MIVEIGILIISVIITWRAFFPTLTIENKFVKNLFFKVIALLFVLLSVINIYNTNKENEDLIQTAKKILKKTDTLNTGLVKSLDLIQQSSSQIDGVKFILDSVRDISEGQVSLLDKAVKESEKLVALENKNYYDSRPVITSSSVNLKFINDSISDEWRVRFPLLNTGRRPAYDISVRAGFIIADFQKQKIVKHYTNKDSLLIPSLNVGNLNLKKALFLIESDIINISDPNMVVYFVSKIKYEDFGTHQKFVDFFMFESKEFSKNKSFVGTQKDTRDIIIDFIEDNGLFEEVGNPPAPEK